MVPNGLPSSRYFWPLPAQTASSRSGGSDRQVLDKLASLFSHAHQDYSLFPPFYPLGLITPRVLSHSFAPLSWRSEKSRPRSYLLGLNLTVTRGGLPRQRQHSRRQETHRRDQGGPKYSVGPLCPVRDQYLTAVAKIGADTP